MKRLVLLFTLLLGSLLIIGCETDTTDNDINSDNDQDNEQVEVILDSNIENANLKVSPNSIVDIDTDVTVTASDLDGFEFVHWEDIATGDVVSIENPYTFTAIEDVNITAIFSQISEESAVQEAMTAFNNDFGHMETLIERLDSSNAIEYNIDFYMEFTNSNGNVETMDVYLEQRVIGEEFTTRETILTITLLGTSDEEIKVHTIISETDDYIEAYVDIGFILDTIETQNNVNYEELLALESNMLHVMLPETLRDEFNDVLFSNIQKEFNNTSINEDTMGVILEKIESMKNYYNLDYFTSLESLTLEAEIINEQDILTNVTVHNEASKVIFEDVFRDIYNILFIAEFEKEMLPYDEMIATPEYQNILMTIDESEGFSMDIIHTPADSDSMHIDFKLQDFIMRLKEYWPPAENATVFDLEVTIKDDAEIAAIDDAKDVYVLAEELYMMSVLNTSVYFLNNLDQQSNLVDGTYTLETIVDYGLSIDVPVIDLQQSTITITNGVATIDLIYKNNGLQVFKEPMTLDEFISFGVSSEEPPTTREELLNMMTVFNKDNLNIDVVLIDMLRFIGEEMSKDNGETGSNYDEFPDADLVNFPDLDDLPRYPDSVLTNALDGDLEQVRTYVIQEAPQVVYEYYLNYLQNSNIWTIEESAYTNTENTGYFVLSNGTIETNVVITSSNSYENSTEITFTKADSTNSTDPEEFPNEDVIALDDVDVIPRYPESILVDGSDSETIQIRVYLSDEDPQILFDFYIDYYTNAYNWNVIDSELNIPEEEGHISLVSTNMSGIVIGFYPSENYINAWVINIQYTE